jgi:nicotinate dehydrogenase subunit B
MDRLSVRNGVVTVDGVPGRAVTYGDLIGNRQFNVRITGKAPQKPVARYGLVTTRVPRVDIPDKVSGKYVYMQHVRVPNMLHGRIVRPRGQGAYGDGAKVISIDTSSINDIPGARVVRRGDFVGVVAEHEWDAVRAAEKLKVEWDVPPRLPAPGKLFEAMRASRTTDSVVVETGEVPAALTQAAHVVSATYYGPYQSHAPFAPSCALADVGAGSALVVCSTQFPHGVRNMLARRSGCQRIKSGSNITKAPAYSAAPAMMIARSRPRLFHRWAGLCGSSLCAGTNWVGTITARPTWPTCALVSTPPATSLRSNTKVGITAGARPRPPRN